MTDPALSPSRRRRWPLVLALGTAIALGACSPRISQRGNPPDPDALARIEPGKSTREDVASLLGSPSTVAPFGPETWLYIAARTERLAFLEPDVLEQEVVAVAFDERGRVAEIRRYDLADAREIDPVDRKTPTSGKKLTIVQQLIGNLGRFNTGGDTP